MNEKKVWYLSIVFFYLFCLHNMLICQEREKIAVMDIRAYDIDKKIAVMVNEFIRNDLFELGNFELVERSQIELVLKEQKLQMSGILSNKKAVKVGEVVGAKKIVIGTLSRLGEKYFLVLRIVDVENSVILASRAGECMNDDELKFLSKRVVSRLIAVEKTHEKYNDLDDILDSHMKRSGRDLHTPFGIINGIGCGALIGAIADDSGTVVLGIIGGGGVGGALGYRNGKSIDRANAILKVHPEIKELAEKEKKATWSVFSTVFGLPYGLLSGVIAAGIFNDWENPALIITGMVGGGYIGYRTGRKIDRSDAVNKIYKREYRGKKGSFYYQPQPQEKITVNLIPAGVYIRF
ncbi:MAG: hypothetical protein JW983_03445 [Elusimicrobia bacterium]|nr:hypothetical protein [Elusimicrobiota bacterium]